MPDATTLLKLWRLLEKHKLGEALFAKIGEVLQANGMKLHMGMDSETVRAVSPTDELERLFNSGKSRVRSRVEQVFGVVKKLWGLTKVRYRGLAKNGTRAFLVTAHANLLLARKRLLA